MPRRRRLNSKSFADRTQKRWSQRGPGIANIIPIRNELDESREVEPIGMPIARVAPMVVPPAKRLSLSALTDQEPDQQEKFDRRNLLTSGLPSYLYAVPPEIYKR